MKKTTKFVIPIMVFLLLFMPILSSAAIVPDCEGKDCNWDKLIDLIDNVLDFLLNVMAIPIAAIMFTYAGFLLITSGGDTGRRSKAKSIFLNVLLGLVIAVAAWTLIKLLLTTLGYSGPGLKG